MRSSFQSVCTSRHLLKTVLVLAFLALQTMSLHIHAENVQQQAGAILEAAGVKGGLVVHLGCGDGKLTAALRANESYLIHGLDADAGNIRKARDHIRSLGLYGKVSAEHWAGPALPYSDNLVNLIVSDGIGKLSAEEVNRALVPGGVAYIRKDGQWTKKVKPVPPELDEWTHYLHDPSNNAVAHDRAVGPLRHLQWAGSPRWSRHHDHMASTSALVSSGGRMFYIFDEGSRVSILLPPKWTLIARDAFNGTILWKRPIPDWYTHLHRLKSGPAQLPRRLVAIGNRVYVTLGLDAPLTALDAATGETIRTYLPELPTREIIASDGVLFVLTSGKDPVLAAEQAQRRGVEGGNLMGTQVVALNAESGQVIWKKDSPVMTLTLAADDKRVCFHDGDQVVALDRKTGKQLWTSPAIPRRTPLNIGFGPTLVMHEGIVLFAGGESRGKANGTDTMTAISAETGKVLWTAEHPPSGYRSPEDILVSGGLVWTGETTMGSLVGVFTGRDPKTGEVRSKFEPDVKTHWFHHRCYRARATDKYLLTSRTGIEFIDHQAKSWEIHHWTRGGCLYGIMPCNGMVYTPPHNCACYPEAKTYGFNAMAPATPSRRMIAPGREDGRLQKGPAFDAIEATPAGEADWPTYRCDNARTGRTSAQVPAELDSAWNTKLGGRLSTVTVADGKVFVATIDTHTLHALAEDSGKTVWSYTASGRVDSPPTVYQGRVLFGSTDGWVYCLRSSDGELAWRFRAAPSDIRLMAYEQLESVWPVPGNVLVQDGVVYCVAGRSMFFDGGLRLCRIDAKTGKLLSETALDNKAPGTEETLQKTVKGLNMAVALPDILSSVGKTIFMRSLAFDMNGKRKRIDIQDVRQQTGEEAHVFAPFGFRDGSWFHRSYWVYGRTYTGGAGGYYIAGKNAPSGRLLVPDESRVYGFGRLPKYYKWTTTMEYQLFAAGKEPKPKPAAPRKPAKQTGGTQRIQFENTDSLDPTGKPLAIEAWVKTSDPEGVVVARGGPAQGFALIVKGGYPRFVVRSKTVVSGVTGKEKLKDEWVHLTGVLTADKELQVYVNGTLSASAAGSGLITAVPAQPMEIGTDGGGSVGEYPRDQGFKGLIDEVRLYHGSLSAEEIKAHVSAAGAAPAADAKLVMLCSFDKGEATDGSGLKNHGTAISLKPAKGKHGDAMKFTRKKGKKKRKRPPSLSVVDYQWTQQIPILARALVMADKTLFVAGPPDLVDEEEARPKLLEEETGKQLQAQLEALEGKKGALLLAVSSEDGKTLNTSNLPALPVWDGIAAANGKLFIALENGSVLCLGKGD